MAAIERLEGMMMAMNARMDAIQALAEVTNGQLLHLENCTETPQTVELNAATLLDGIVERVASEMAKRHREYVEIGRDESNSPIYKWVEGKNKQDLFKSIAKTLIEHGCLTTPGLEAQHLSTSFKAKPKTQHTKRSEHQREPILFEPYAQEWMRRYKEGKIKETTLTGYKTVNNCHLFPFFGKMDIRNITIDTVQDFLNSKSETHTVKSIIDMRIKLGSVLNAALEDGIITMNPARSKRLVITSEVETSTREPLTEDEMTDVLDHLDNLTERHDRLYIAIPLFTGMRRGEVLGLQWGDIDFEKNIVHVRRGIAYTSNTPIIDTPKTEKGKRTVPLDPQLKALLMTSKQPISPHTFVIGGEGEAVTHQTVTRMWERINKTIDLHGATLHCFRHTFITFAYRAGVSEKALQVIGGIRRHQDHAECVRAHSTAGHRQGWHAVRRNV